MLYFEGKEEGRCSKISVSSIGQLLQSAVYYTYIGSHDCLPLFPVSATLFERGERVYERHAFRQPQSRLVTQAPAPPSSASEASCAAAAAPRVREVARQCPL